MRSFCVFMALTFAVCNANAQFGEVFRKLGNTIGDAIDGKPDENKTIINKYFPQKDAKVEEKKDPAFNQTKEPQIAIVSSDNNIASSSFFEILSEKQILDKRAYQIRRLVGTDVLQHKRNLTNAFADMGYVNIYLNVDDSNKTNSIILGKVVGGQGKYDIDFYLKKVGNTYLMRIFIDSPFTISKIPAVPPSISPIKNLPDVTEKNYIEIWERLGTSAFVDKIAVNPREIQ